MPLRTRFAPCCSVGHEACLSVSIGTTKLHFRRWLPLSHVGMLVSSEIFRQGELFFTGIHCPTTDLSELTVWKKRVQMNACVYGNFTSLWDDCHWRYGTDELYTLITSPLHHGMDDLLHRVSGLHSCLDPRWHDPLHLNLYTYLFGIQSRKTSLVVHTFLRPPPDEMIH